MNNPAKGVETWVIGGGDFVNWYTGTTLNDEFNELDQLMPWLEAVKTAAKQYV